MRNLAGWLAIAVVAVTACGPSERDGSGNGTVDSGSGPGEGGVPGGNQDNCSDAAKLVYVVDQNYKLLQFDPPTKTFTDLGALSCPAGGATPFSMAVDRNAIAWVLYSSGELFRVDIKNGLGCTKSAWPPGAQGFVQFGMGFSTDTAGGSTDTLYIGGGIGSTQTTSMLARVNLGTFQATPFGSAVGWPELTGTGNAELWGFFPGATSARIVQIDKTNGSSIRNYPMTSLNGDPLAWAFAFHGGDFWVFLKRGLDAYTTVYQVDSMTGALKGQTPTTGLSIVGAGVSTCAPVIL